MLENNSEIIETEIGLLYWIDKRSGIVCGKTKPNVDITIDRLKNDFLMYENHFPHSHKKLLLDMSDLLGADKKVRDFFAGSEGVYNYFDAVAVLVKSRYSIAGIIGYVALKVYPLQKPTQLFFDKQEAIKWLKSL